MEQLPNSNRYNIVDIFTGINDSKRIKDEIRDTRHSFWEYSDNENLYIFDKASCDEENAIVQLIEPEFPNDCSNYFPTEEERKQEENPHKYNSQRAEENQFIDQAVEEDQEFRRLLEQQNLQSLTKPINEGEKVLYAKIENDSQYEFSGNELYVTRRGVFSQPHFLSKEKYNRYPILKEKVIEIGRRAPDPEIRNCINIFSVNTSTDKDHAHLIWRTAYNQHAAWVQSFFCFLWTQKQENHQRNSKYRILTRIPFEINELILQFAREPFDFYLQDRGSKKDTYQKISSKIPTALKPDRQLLLGDDVFLNIIEVKNSFNVESDTREFLEDSLFNKTMKKLMLKEKVKILGTGNEYLYHLQNSAQNFNENEDPELKLVTWNSTSDFEIPYVKLELTNVKKSTVEKILLFPHTQGSFMFGRCHEADIILYNNACSRRQIRISWENINGVQKWVAYDGENDNPSTKGTWMSIRTLTEKTNEMCSGLTPLQNESVFRFGSNQVTFLINKINFNKTDLDSFKTKAKALAK